MKISSPPSQNIPIGGQVREEEGPNLNSFIKMYAFDKSSSLTIHGEVSELADEHDLGSCAARRGSSSLPFPMSINSLTGIWACPTMKLDRARRGVSGALNS